jgi:hypothetical protein
MGLKNIYKIIYLNHRKNKVTTITYKIITYSHNVREKKHLVKSNNLKL